LRRDRSIGRGAHEHGDTPTNVVAGRNRCGAARLRQTQLQLGINRLGPVPPLRSESRMAKLEAPKVLLDVRSARPSGDQNCVPDSPSYSSALTLADHQSIESRAVVHDQAQTLKHGHLQRNDDDELWGFKTVIAKTGLSRSSLYGYVALGIFPRQRRLGPRRVAWLASEVRAWIANRPF
jgi:prophage regulatory protein